jgi:hypothetical protein
MLRHCVNPEEFYIRQLMPKKLAVDLQYQTSRTFWSDLKLLLEMVLLILGRSNRIDRDFFVVPSKKSRLGNTRS